MAMDKFYLKDEVNTFLSLCINDDAYINSLLHNRNILKPNLRNILIG